MARMKITKRKMTKEEEKVAVKQPRKWLGCLHRLCTRNIENEDYESRILRWFDSHKNDTTYVKACALYNHTPLGRTGLHHILNEGYSFVSVIEIWLKYAPEAAQVKDAWGRLPLHIACSILSSLEVVMVLIEAYPKGVEEGDMNKLLPLHLSCCNGGGQLEVVKALIDAYPKGAEERDIVNHLPLHVACSYAMPPSVEVLSILLQANPKSIDGEDNLRIASFRLKSVLIRDSDEDEDPLETDEEEVPDNELISQLIHEATKGGHFLVVKLFVTAFPQSVMMQDEDGMLPLHYACSNIKYVDIGMVLLDANPESAFVTDKMGRTSLQLLMPLAKVEDKKGELLLHALAARSTILTVNFVKLLIAAYPDSLYVQGNSGMLPFQYAFMNKSLSVDVLMYFVEMNSKDLR